MTIPDSGVDLLLRRATDDLRPDIDRLVAAGLTRGRSRQRRARIGTAVATLAVFGVIGVGATVVPQLGGGAPDSAPAPIATDPPAPAPVTTPAAPALGTLVVAAADIPAAVDDILGTSQAGPALEEAPYGVDDSPRSKTVSFRYAGMLATVIIEPQPGDGSVCTSTACPSGTDGSVISSFGPETNDGVTAQGVTVLRQGYAVTVNSYNAADGKDSPALAPEPVLTMELLVQIASSEAWFS